MLMVEEVRESDFGNIKKNQVGIMQIFRYGIQLITSIGDTGKADLKFKNIKIINNDNGDKKLSVDIENTGEKHLAINIWVEIYDTEGNYIGKFEDAEIHIYPGTSTRRVVNLGNLSTGEYKAMIVADAGGDQIFGSSYNLKFN